MKMLRKNWPGVICAWALTLGCDALPKLQVQLQSEIRREFGLTYALVMVIDTTNLVVAVFDDARAELHPKELAVFQENVAGYAVRHYQRGRVKGVVVIVDRATDKAGVPQAELEPAVFLPEYHPDGGVRLAPLPRGAIAIPADPRFSAPPK